MTNRKPLHCLDGHKLVCIALLAALVALSSNVVALAAIGSLPPPTTPGNAFVFGNFDVYSLGYLYNLSGSKDSNFNVQSSPGQIASDVVILTGAGGVGVNTNLPGIDNAFLAPNGSVNQEGSAYFTTADNQIYGSVAPIHSGVWTAGVSALRNTLGSGNQLTFYFNLNQEGSGSNPSPNIGPGGTSAPAQDLLAFARVTLSGGSTGGVANTPLSFYLTSLNTASVISNISPPPGVSSTSLDNGPQPNPKLAGFNPPPDPFTGLPASGDTRWVYVHGTITVNQNTGAFVHYGPIDGTESVPVKEVNQNLGQNSAAFAIYSKQLSDLVMGVTSSTFTDMTVYTELSGLDNGYEQVFIRATQVRDGGIVPEPASLVVWSLLGVGGAGLVVRRCRARRVS